jgi:hypothetical protein
MGDLPPEQDVAGPTQSEFDELVRLARRVSQAGLVGPDGFIPVTDHDWLWHSAMLRRFARARAIRLLETHFERGFFVLDENGKETPPSVNL